MTRKKGKSIQTRLMIIWTIVLHVQIVCLLLFYQYGGILSTLQSNSIQIFQETTKQSKLNMERELMSYWMGGIQDVDEISETIEMILQETGYNTYDIRTNPQLNQLILDNLTERLIDVLHYSFGNGVYFILDGPASMNGDPKEQAGISIRDVDSNSYEADYSDLLMKRGSATIAKKYGIALDSYWELGFNLEEMENKNFYQKPFAVAEEVSIKQEDDIWCAYLDTVKSKQGQKIESLCYSMPIMLSDGSVVGIVGGEIVPSRVQEFMETGIGNTDNGNILSLFVRGKVGESSFTPVIAEDAMYKQYFGTMKTIEYRDGENESIKIVEDKDGREWYATIEPLQVYSENTPFENETWSVVQLQQEKDLFANTHTVQKILMTSVTLSLFIGFLLISFASRVVSMPIKNLIREMGELDLDEKSHLKKIQIKEIDELVDAINHLNDDVLENASKLSQTLDMLDMEIGVFEYDEVTEKIFCSHSLLKLFGMEEKGYRFLSREQFLEQFAKLKNPIQEENDRIYEFETEQAIRYIKMKRKEVNGVYRSGVLFDVTEEMNRQKQLEQERDIDSLTGLYNRSGFQKEIEKLIRENKIEVAAFVMWDMDKLKQVNDTYGHDAGDRYICAFANYLRTLENFGAVVEHRSGDEFMAVIYKGEESHIRQTVRNFMEQLKEISVDLPDGEQIYLKASAGISWYPKQSTDIEELIKYADFAMYQSKEERKGIVKEFDLSAKLTDLDS